jgi:hypothetical protein
VTQPRPASQSWCGSHPRCRSRPSDRHSPRPRATMRPRRGTLGQRSGEAGEQRDPHRRAAPRRRAPASRSIVTPRHPRAAWHPAADRPTRPSSPSRRRAPRRRRGLPAGRGRSWSREVARSAAVRIASSTGTGVRLGRRGTDRTAPGPRAAGPTSRDVRRVARPGAWTQHGLRAVEHAERRHGDRQGVGCREVAASTAQPGRARRTRWSPRASSTKCTLVASGRASDEQRRRARAHRGDVGEVDRRRLPAEVEPARPRQPEVGTVHEVSVETTTAPGNSEDRVVPRADERRGRSVRASKTRRRSARSPSSPTVGSSAACIPPR